jgi:hypothetical protein
MVMEEDLAALSLSRRDIWGYDRGGGPHGNLQGLARTGVEYREQPKRGTKVAKIEP